MTESRRPLALLVNPVSGGGKAGRILPRVERRLRQAGAEYRVETTRSGEHAVAAAEAAAAGGAIPVVVSGDGLIGMIGGALAEKDVPVGIIPAGRGNDLARVLGIPEDPVAAAELLLKGHSRRIDVGEANGRRFLCIASTGFDSDANRIANEARRIKGRAVYAYAALRALAAWKPARFKLTLADRSLEFEGFSVAVANSKAYGGGMYVAPDAELDDGLLDIVTVGTVGKLRFLLNLPKVFKGTHVHNDEVSVHRSASVELSADRPFALYADGEHLTDLPAAIRLLPRALAVIVPATEARG